MPKKPDDGIVVWKESKASFLPKDIAKDKLATFLKLLIGKVKEDHARLGYKKDLKDYRPEIIQIVALAKQNGYKLTSWTQDDAEETHQDKQEQNPEEDDGIDWDNITDG